jgi:membrane protein YdbS with pleckstrin-like domain
MPRTIEQYWSEREQRRQRVTCGGVLLAALALAIAAGYVAGRFGASPRWQVAAGIAVWVLVLALGGIEGPNA